MTGLVLAGGGAKGAFEAGAVKYLVEEEAVVPDVIAATSVGAICATILAQARTHQELLGRVRQLHDALLAMTHSELLFGRQPWLDALGGTPFGDAVDAYVIDRTRPPVPGQAAGDPPSLRPHRRWGAAAVRYLPHLLRAQRAYRRDPRSVFTLDPLAGALRHGGMLAPVDPALVGRPGLELRLAVAALGAGVLRFVTGRGELVEADAVTPVAGAGPVDLLEGALASASVPMVFPPRPLGDDVYVDGGVLDNVPVAAAARLGATRIYAVLAVPLVQPPDRRDFSRMSGAGVFLRSVGPVAFAARQLANLHPPLPPGVAVTVIDPVIDVVGPFEVSQGLMLLDMDYGWLRAADVLADVPDDVRRRAAAATDEVAAARTRAWHCEEVAWAAGRATAAQRAEIEECKRSVRDALAERKGLGLPTPPDADRWWTGYEQHAGSQPVGLP
jgi:NTE family protein